jgi:hypothetical protein
MIEEPDFFFLTGLEYSHFIITLLPTPLMNYFSVILLVLSKSNYLKSRSPQNPFLWKNSWKFSILTFSVESLEAMSLKIMLMLVSYESVTELKQLYVSISPKGSLYQPLQCNFLKLPMHSLPFLINIFENIVFD